MFFWKPTPFHGKTFHCFPCEFTSKSLADTLLNKKKHCVFYKWFSLRRSSKCSIILEAAVCIEALWQRRVAQKADEFLHFQGKSLEERRSHIFCYIIWTRFTIQIFPSLRTVSGYFVILNSNSSHQMTTCQSHLTKNEKESSSMSVNIFLFTMK